MIKKYRPILVFYVPDRGLINDQIPMIKEYAKNNGYDVLIWENASSERLEIVSVDASTHVTDIQEWINNRIKENNN
ncbi:MAG: hypothetical protein ACOCP8_03490 [archaeon]